MNKRMDFKDLKSIETFLLDMLAQYVELASVTTEPRADEGHLYEKGVTAYRDGSPDEALSCFAKLVLMEPLSADYWMGVASALHQSLQLEKALSCYAVVGLLDEEDPACHFHAAQIFLHWKDETEFLKALELAQARATLNAKHAPWLEKIACLKEIFYQKGKRAYG